MVPLTYLCQYWPTTVAPYEVMGEQTLLPTINHVKFAADYQLDLRL
jgi:hypothetical protein